jgi:hypothetical protein
MSFGNDWNSVMIVHKVREQELLNQAANERRVKELKHEEEQQQRHWKLRINNNPGR